MVVEYISDVNSLLNCENILLVELKDNYALDKNLIPSYVPGFSMFEKEVPGHKVDGEFMFTENELDGIILSAIILYNYSGSPIGFCQLNNPQSIPDLHVQTLHIKLDFTVITEYVDLELDFSYTTHIKDSNKFKSHKNLINHPNYMDRVVRFEDINEYYDNRQIYTKNIIQAFRNSSSENKWFRYSGGLTHKDPNNIRFEKIVSRDQDFGSIVGIMQWDITQYTLYVKRQISGNQFQIMVTDGTAPATKDIEGPNEVIFGTNFIVIKIPTEKQTYRYQLYKHNQVTHTLDEIQYGLFTTEDLEIYSDKFHFVKDPLTKEIYTVILSKDKWEICDPLAIRYLRELNLLVNPKYNLNTIIYLSQGIAVYKIPLDGDNYKYEIITTKGNYTLSGVVVDLTVITSTAIYYKIGNLKFLLELVTDYDYSPNIQSLSSTWKIWDLNSQGDPNLNMDKLVKNMKFINLNSTYELLPLSYQGCMYARHTSTLNHRIILTKL